MKKNKQNEQERRKDIKKKEKGKKQRMGRRNKADGRYGGEMKWWKWKSEKNREWRKDGKVEN